MGSMQYLIAAILAVVAVMSIAWFIRHRAAGSDRRLVAMLKHAGVDPAIAASEDGAAIIREIRRRCRRCQTEDVCQRWLAGGRTGSNDFCPNARVLEQLGHSLQTPG